MRIVTDRRGIVRQPPPSPYPLPLPSTPAPSPIPRQPATEAPPLAQSTTPEEARLKDRLAWTGIGLAGAGAGWLIFKSLAAATGIGVAAVAGGMLLRDYNRARA